MVTTLLAVINLKNSSTTSSQGIYKNYTKTTTFYYPSKNIIIFTFLTFWKPFRELVTMIVESTVKTMDRVTTALLKIDKER